jgi:MFS family permease
LTLGAVIVYWLNLRGPRWVDYAALVAIGFLVYGPIMLTGLHALDLAPKKAAGFTGLFRYVFGSAIAGTGVGWIADRWNWGGVFIAMIACCALAMLFSRRDRAIRPTHRPTQVQESFPALATFFPNPHDRGRTSVHPGAEPDHGPAWRKWPRSLMPSGRR